MPNPKIHDEFHTIDLSTGWEVPEGYPEGMKQKILAGSLDEENGTGNRTRLLKIDAGTFTTEPFVHEYWEEVYMLSGDLTVGNDETARVVSLSLPIPMPAGHREHPTARSNLKMVA